MISWASSLETWMKLVTIIFLSRRRGGITLCQKVAAALNNCARGCLCYMDRGQGRWSNKEYDYTIILLGNCSGGDKGFVGQ